VTAATTPESPIAGTLGRVPTRVRAKGRATIQSGGGRPAEGRVEGIWWRASGAGSPLVLVQGLGYPAAMFHRLVPLLEPYFRVILFDQRGIGNSAKAGRLASLTIGSMAADVAAVIREVVGQAADVMGVSLGGIVAQELALAYPDLVRSAGYRK